jgi:hypothetical protein
MNFEGISETTSTFRLFGGRVGISAGASSWGSITLEVLATDERSWLVAAPPLTANGVVFAEVLPGQYRLELIDVVDAYIAVQPTLRAS